jgi:hypothetical protein
MGHHHITQSEMGRVAADKKRGELVKKYYEFTTVHHFGASECSARLW